MIVQTNKQNLWHLELNCCRED